MLQKMMQISDLDFGNLLEQRKKEVSQFINLAIQPIK
jgi:hypothetical protein